MESVEIKNRNEHPDRLKLYYFPDINVDMSPEFDAVGGHDTGFQKADFGSPSGGDLLMDFLRRSNWIGDQVLRRGHVIQ